MHDLCIELAHFIVDLNYTKEALFNRASSAIKEYYEIKGVVPEDDHYIVSMQQFYKELLNATGCEGVHWSYM